MKRIGFILIVILTAALLMPALSIGQSTDQVAVNGRVYSGAFPISGAKVQIYAWDGKNMGNAPLRTVTTSDGSNGPAGTFSFKNVPFDTPQPFSYAVMAEKDGRSAYALVHYVPPETPEQKPFAEPIILDLSMDSWVTDLTGIVQSGNLMENAIGVPNANVAIYARNQTTGEPLGVVKASTTTDSLGKFEIKNLPYGLYQAVVTATVNNKQYIEKANFTAYGQEGYINVVMSGVILTPTPQTPTQSPTGGFGIPGFEAVLALAALSGTALYLKKR